MRPVNNVTYLHIQLKWCISSPFINDAHDLAALGSQEMKNLGRFKRSYIWKIRILGMHFIKSKRS